MTLVKAYKSFMFLSIIAILGMVAWMMNSLIELMIMLTCFLVVKEKYEFKYHCKSAFQCLIISVLVFIAGLRLSLPVSVSYTCCGILGLCIAHIAQYLAKLKFIREDYEYIEPRYNKFMEEQRQKNIYKMCESELRAYCKENRLNDIDEEIVIQRLIYHRKGQDLYEKIGYSKIQMIRREKRIESKLNIKLKQT